MNLIFVPVKQIRKDLFDSLVQCQADFRYSHMENQFNIKHVNRIHLKEDRYNITFELLGNPTIAMICINKDNIEEMEITNE